jgi:hypothetical protein
VVLASFAATEPSATSWADDTSTYTKESEDSLTFVVQKDFSLLKDVLVDGQLLPASDYTAQAGSTEVTLLPAYLDTLTSADHAITVEFTDGATSASAFTVKDAPVVNPSDNGSGGSGSASDNGANSGSSNASGASTKPATDITNPALPQSRESLLLPLTGVILLTLALAAFVACAISRRFRRS